MSKWFPSHHSDSRILDRSEDHPDPRGGRQPNWFRSFSRRRVFFGTRWPEGCRGWRTAFHRFTRRRRRSQDKISFGLKLRKRRSSVIPEGNKGNKGTRKISKR